MPVYGLGTWEMGGRTERDFTNDDARDIQAIKSAIDLGVTHIDTAEKYADGYTETLVGEGIKEYDRSKLFLVSKVRKEKLSYDAILKSCDESLARIGTTYLDMFMLHFYSTEVSLKDSMHALDRLVEENKVRHIAVANFTKERFTEAQSYTSNKIVCNQLHYNLIFREPEREDLVEYCQDNDVFLTAWRPVQKGLLTSGVPEILDSMSKKYNKTPAQVAINWLISQDNVITIAKTSNVEHLKENLGALSWQMETEDVERLRAEFPGQKDVSDAVPLR